MSLLREWEGACISAQQELQGFGNILIEHGVEREKMSRKLLGTIDEETAARLGRLMKQIRGKWESVTARVTEMGIIASRVDEFAETRKSGLMGSNLKQIVGERFLSMQETAEEMQREVRLRRRVLEICQRLMFSLDRDEIQRGLVLFTSTSPLLTQK
uniref:Uncharacterized protein n=1 Tax=Chromera velia CCMP2878 TaxID=1169474 RepID=A0A0G4HN22_9ALVE|eukprot:Cvel_7635.t1-p1 / transcript=Cvel_7635.t1 / gene=Cvel_7635 / organism=Chromera_velia_CCMP2878 / gene_product=hypothetical protein / transcript_product=hypothetical protein / location=Cvel_scaffold403:63110-66115(-) / protein_length=156 / sequence_SO=supercontig / SO=protein_coding / is_pseudo=false